MHTKRYLLAGVLPALFVLVFFGMTIGQTDDSSLQRKVEKLERNLRVLENRVEAIENRIKPGKQGAPASRAVWRQLKPGMTKGQVRALLGEPLKTSRYFWHYSTGYPAASVQFGQDATVVNWKEP